MIQKHPNHFSLGIGMMMIGFWLIANDRFFQWPPHALDLVNDDIWGGLFIIIGIVLVLWVFDGGDSVKWNRVILSVSAGAMAFLAVYQFMIWAVTGAYLDWIGNLIITAFVVNMARRSDSREHRDNKNNS